MSGDAVYASRLGGMSTPPFPQAQRQWYHWFQAAKRGAQAVRDDPKGFARIMWDNWSPPGWYDEATFEAVAQSWQNPDWVDVARHAYRARWDEAEPDPRSAALEEKIKATKTLAVPTVDVQGAVDGVNPPEASENVPSKFSGSFALKQLEGVGHVPTREAPESGRDPDRAFLPVSRQRSPRDTGPEQLTRVSVGADLQTGASPMISTPVRYGPAIEDVKPDEAQTIEQLCETFDTILKTTAKDYGHAVRSVHAKAHGILEGTLIVDAGLPSWPRASSPGPASTRSTCASQPMRATSCRTRSPCHEASP